MCWDVGRYFVCTRKDCPSKNHGDEEQMLLIFDPDAECNRGFRTCAAQMGSLFTIFSWAIAMGRRIIFVVAIRNAMGAVCTCRTLRSEPSRKARVEKPAGRLEQTGRRRPSDGGCRDAPASAPPFGQVVHDQTRAWMTPRRSRESSGSKAPEAPTKPRPSMSSTPTTPSKLGSLPTISWANSPR